MTTKKKYKGTVVSAFKVGGSKSKNRVEYKEGQPYETTNRKSFEHLVTTKRIIDNG